MASRGGSAAPSSSSVLPEWLRNVTAKQAALAGLGVSAALGYAYLNSMSPDLSKDFGTIMRLARVKRKVDSALKNKQTVADMFNAVLQAHPNKEAIVFVDKQDPLTRNTKVSYTYAEVEAESNKVANWALSIGLKEKDVVALMMDNRPEFIFMWLGMTKIGVLTSLINTNLRGHVLRHSMAVCKATHYFVGHEHMDVISRELVSDLGGKWYSCGGPAPEGNLFDLDSLLAASNNTTAIPRSFRANTSATDKLFYIYTSGTTGAPKAALVSHLKFLTAGLGFVDLMDVGENDRLYTALPLYHSAATLIGVSTTWNGMGTLILRRKFSANSFWEDIATHKATVFQYIGELCRYLLSHPPKPSDSQHQLRLAIGNGLRPDIWAEFQKRFNIPQIGEFYAATEGNVALLNSFNKVGAVGYLSPLIRMVHPGRLVKFDVESEMPVRDPKTGFCLECEQNEIGEMLGNIKPDDPLRQFLGYTDSSATEKKVLRDVFTKGDMWFRTGDLLRIDREGYVYFVDRIGDTFRWKGENVATTEVAEVITTGNVGVQECNVYGVKVPHKDGRAGMACIIPVDRATFDMAALYKLVRTELPLYAAPLFVRVTTAAMDVTGTFKHKKTELVEQGFNPHVITDDELYFRDDLKGAFVPLTKELYQRITNNTAAAKL
jgi:fatty-acyl-CoA synthase